MSTLTSRHPDSMHHPSPRAGWTTAPTRDIGSFLARALTFLLIGVALYGATYAWSERLVYQHAKRNRFFMIRTAPHQSYDVVVLGASHAAVFDYDDMNARLEALTGARVLNLAVVGAGIVVNRLLLDYFLASHATRSVVYVVDSFAFTARAWNEDRLQDARLYTRAPFDLTLARLLWARPAGRTMVLPYVSGFQKINNAERFTPDVRDDELTRFDRVYRPVPQIDQQRLDYLYPAAAVADTAAHDRYFEAFETMARDLRAAGIQLLVVKPPLPERVHRALPAEAAFDDRLRALVERHGASFHDFSAVNNAPAFFYDTDHLNRVGVTSFFEKHFAPLLRGAQAPGAAR